MSDPLRSIRDLHFHFLDLDIVASFLARILLPFWIHALPKIGLRRHFVVCKLSQNGQTSYRAVEDDQARG